MKYLLLIFVALCVLINFQWHDDQTLRITKNSTTQINYHNKHKTVVKTINFISIPKYREIKDNLIYADVLSHSKSKPFGNTDGRYTNVHETSHGISSEIRSNYRNQYEYQINGIYMLFGKGVVLKEPKILITDITKNIPVQARGYRYKTYFIDQTKYWNEQPLYILEEWNCYILGAECGVDDWENNYPLEKTDAVSGAIEFAIYNIAMAKTIYELDKNYWDSYQSFKDIIEYNLLRSYHVFSLGKNIESFKSQKQDYLYSEFQNSPALMELRKFAKKNFYNTEWIRSDE